MSPPPLTDAELLVAARTNPEAFREFYERYAVWMRSWFERHTGSEAAALDLTAETFAQAWRSIRRFKDMADGSAGPWLFGIARNLLRQHHKRHRIESVAHARLDPRVWAGEEEFEAADERLAADALSSVLDAAVTALPRDQRDALRLRIIDQLPYEEVAVRLGCSINAARLRVSRALRVVGSELREAPR